LRSLAVPSPPCGMATLVSTGRPNRVVKSSKPTVWDGD